MTATDTIYALSTVPGRSAIAVVRVSGPQAHQSLQALSDEAGLPPARLLARRRLIAPDGTMIDEAMVVRFDAPASYTGENIVEYQIHGGVSVAGALVRALAGLPGLRAAEPGEFSRRAFDNEKMDLTGAEGVIDLIEAETDSQRRQALHQMDGAARQVCEDWTERLVTLLAVLEASIDFADDDLPAEAFQVDRPALTALRQEIENHIARGEAGERLRLGVRVALIGAPNVGKSSLLNALARRDAAIVSDIAGTTRDAIEVHLNIAGNAVILTDTAGLRDTEDSIERQGVDRARRAAEVADLVILVRDARDPEFGPGTAPVPEDRCLMVWNKADLAAPVGTGLAVSAKTGNGLADLEAAMAQAIETRFAVGEGAVMTRARYREALADCLASIDGALAGTDLILVVEDLRRAVRAIGRITGRVDVEDILDRIFSSFCIGK
ncbi:MAG: tRNA uridine-5-carboxymethylaminomethyl(34) synthesis GTPase MnmE [Alphaproteobacteria bacterium]